MPVGTIKVTVTTAGTPVQVSAARVFASNVRVQPRLVNTGKTFLGLAGLVRATGVNVIAEMPIPPVGGMPEVAIDAPQEQNPNPIDLSALWVDADVSGESVLVSYVQV